MKSLIVALALIVFASTSSNAAAEVLDTGETQAISSDLTLNIMRNLSDEERGALEFSFEDIKSKTSRQEKEAKCIQRGSRRYAADLNGDGTYEDIISVDCDVPGVRLRGSSTGFGSTLLFSRNVFLGSVESAEQDSIFMLGTKHRGFNDLEVQLRDEVVGEKSVTTYRFDGKRYNKSEVRRLPLKRLRSRIE